MTKQFSNDIIGTWYLEFVEGGADGCLDYVGNQSVSD
jgi:hypothetical protein